MEIAIVTTGGTIDKDYFDALSEFQVVDSPIIELFKHFHVAFDFELHPLFKKDSLEITDEDRMQIKELVQKLPQNKILITHGTDTMVSTANALKGIENKTIVLTGAMKPARFKETDAIFNIGVAIGALQSKSSGVYVAMSGKIFDPQNVVKDRAKMQFHEII